MQGIEGVEQYEKELATGGHHGGGVFDLFGNLMGGGRGRGTRKGPDFTMNIQVTLEDLYLGAERTYRVKRNVICKKCRGTGAKDGKTKPCKKCKGTGTITTLQQLGPGFNVQMQQTCPDCGGKGKMFKSKCPHCNGRKVVEKVKELEAVIERGMPDGHQLRFPRASEQSPDTIPGDVILRITTQKHNTYERRQNDLLHSMTISLKDALLGFKKSLKRLDGTVFYIERDEVTYPNQVMTIQNEGMPIHNYPSSKGQLEVTFKVKFPKKLNDEQRAAIKKLLT